MSKGRERFICAKLRQQELADMLFAETLSSKKAFSDFSGRFLLFLFRTLSKLNMRNKLSLNNIHVDNEVDDGDNGIVQEMRNVNG